MRLNDDAVSSPLGDSFPSFLLQISAWALVSPLWRMAAVPLSRAASTPRCSAAVRRDAAGLWGRSLRCALSGALVSITTKRGQIVNILAVVNATELL